MTAKHCGCEVSESEHKTVKDPTELLNKIDGFSATSISSAFQRAQDCAEEDVSLCSDRRAQTPRSELATWVLRKKLVIKLGRA